jgi:nicotinate-nucleotide pyrophosphorylase (carboxylating)
VTTPQLIRAALEEDIGSGDITSRLTIPVSRQATAVVVARSRGTLAGIDVCRKVFQQVDRTVRFAALTEDGTRFTVGQVLARVRGRARSLLAAERTALNFVCRLSGIATLTARYMSAIAGTGAKLMDTRKTTPGWRELEKYAVRCGGGGNHRQGLYDMVLIKDNHIAAAGSVSAALRECRGTRLHVEVETRTLNQVWEAVTAGARWIMLDNMPLSRLRGAVALAKGRASLEASGGITLANVREVALTGVNYVSVGALTHSAPAADIALDFLPA